MEPIDMPNEELIGGGTIELRKVDLRKNMHLSLANNELFDAALSSMGYSLLLELIRQDQQHLNNNDNFVDTDTCELAIEQLDHIAYMDMPVGAYSLDELVKAEYPIEDLKEALCDIFNKSAKMVPGSMRISVQRSGDTGSYVVALCYQVVKNEEEFKKCKNQ